MMSKLTLGILDSAYFHRTRIWHSGGRSIGIFRTQSRGLMLSKRLTSSIVFIGSSPCLVVLATATAVWLGYFQ